LIALRPRVLIADEPTSALASVLPGMKTAQEIEEAARCPDAPPLAPDEMARIAALSRKDFR
jgi:hypothetical protein